MSPADEYSDYAITASSSPSFIEGLGHLYAVTLVVFVFLSALLLASYICYHVRVQTSDLNAGDGAGVRSSDGVVPPRIIFVAEDNDVQGGRRGRRSAAEGLDDTAIGSYPKFPFSAANGSDAACSICLGEYREGEMLRMMPDCGHFFHLPCLDEWLRLNASCPICRNSQSQMPTPVSTPLSTPPSEVVPLSHFAANRRR